MPQHGIFYFGRSGGAVYSHSLRSWAPFTSLRFVPNPFLFHKKRFLTMTPQQNKKCHNMAFFILVGVAGFEPATFCPPDKRATRLRYTPKTFCFNKFCADKNKLSGKCFNPNQYHPEHLFGSFNTGFGKKFNFA